MVELTSARKNIARHITRPVVQLLAKTPLTPDILTWFGFLIAVAAAVMVASEHLFAAGFVVLFGGFFDMLDGALARLTNRTTRFGAVLDSTLDRLSEAVVLIGILVFYAGEQSFAGTLVVGLAWAGSLLVSYIRARAEAIGLDCQRGLFTRPERVVILTLGLLLSQFNNALLIAMAVIAVMSFFTAGQRLYHVWRQLKKAT